MNFSQILNPMVLLALGLHALVLFAPMGGESKADSTDPAEKKEVASSELPDKSTATTTPNPAADAKLSATPSGVINSILPVGAVVPSAAATRPAVQSRPVAPAFSARQPIASVFASIPSNNRAVFSGRLPIPTPNPVSAQPPVAQAAANPSQGSQSQNAAELPILPPTNAVPASSSPAITVARAAETPPVATPTSPSAAITDRPIQDSQPPSVATLIASASGKVSTSLRSLAAFFGDGLTYSAEGTDDVSTDQKLAAWTAVTANVEPTPVSELVRVSYPLESGTKEVGRSLNLCLEQPPQSAEIGILFDAQGNVEQLELIRSTGYSALNEEIKATVANYDKFPADRQSQAYILEVPVDYDAEACISLENLK
jgi:hypothetical protein